MPPATPACRPPPASAACPASHPPRCPCWTGATSSRCWPPPLASDGPSLGQHPPPRDPTTLLLPQAAQSHASHAPRDPRTRAKALNSRLMAAHTPQVGAGGRPQKVAGHAGWCRLTLLLGAARKDQPCLHRWHTAHAGDPGHCGGPPGGDGFDQQHGGAAAPGTGGCRLKTLKTSAAGCAGRGWTQPLHECCSRDFFQAPMLRLPHPAAPRQLLAGGQVVAQPQKEALAALMAEPVFQALAGGRRACRLASVFQGVLASAPPAPTLSSPTPYAVPPCCAAAPPGLIVAQSASGAFNAQSTANACEPGAQRGPCKPAPAPVLLLAHLRWQCRRPMPPAPLHLSHPPHCRVGAGQAARARAPGAR